MTVTSMVRLMMAACAAAAVLCFDIPASFAEGDAPWCAVVTLGEGDVYWDCRYLTFEQCAPNVVAGNRGFCNENPWPGSAATATAVAPRHRKRHVHVQ